MCHWLFRFSQNMFIGPQNNFVIVILQIWTSGWESYYSFKEFSTTKWPQLGSRNRVFLIPRLIFFCSTQSSLLRGYFILPLNKTPCNCSLWGPVLTKTILLSFCPPLLGSQQTALLCLRVFSLHTAHSHFFPFSPLGPSLWIHWSLSEFLCVWNLGLISRQSSRNFPTAFPFVPILQSWEKQLFLQWLCLPFSCWLTILWVKSEV